MKSNKRGVSLIVLVITIIVMIILASAVMISLGSTNIIERANEAVDKNNTQEVQQLAALAWAEAYLDKYENKDKNVDLETSVWSVLNDNNITKDDYTVEVTDIGVTVKKADKIKPVVKKTNFTSETLLGVHNYRDCSFELTFSDDEEISSIDISESSIILDGFTAIISITGEGNKRIVTLEDVNSPAAEANGKEYKHSITIAAGVVTDANGNKSDAITFTLNVYQPIIFPDIPLG